MKSDLEISLGLAHPCVEFAPEPIIEHPDLAADEVWIVFDEQAPQVPEDLRDELSVPSILTGNRAQAERTLAPLQAISGGKPLTAATALRFLQ